MAKTSKKDFELFKSECLKWISKFGLLGWRVYFEHTKIDGSFADISCGPLRDRVVTLRLTTNWGTDSITKVAVRRTALHEILELLLLRLTDQNIKKLDADEERHNVIRILENVFTEYEYGLKGGEGI